MLRHSAKAAPTIGQIRNKENSVILWNNSIIHGNSGIKWLSEKKSASSKGPDQNNNVMIAAKL